MNSAKVDYSDPKSFVQLRQKMNEYTDIEGEYHAQLVALDMIGGLNQEMFDPDNEKLMTVRKATEIIAGIDHEELDKVNCDYQAVYDDLQHRYGTAIHAVDKTIMEVRKRGNEIRMRAIENIQNRIDDLSDRGVKNELLIENLREVVDFLQTGEDK